MQHGVNRNVKFVNGSDGRQQWRLAKQEQHSSMFCLPQALLPPAVSPAMLQLAGAAVREDRRITTRHLALTVCHIVQQFGHSKVSARCVHQSHTHSSTKPTERQLLYSFWHAINLRDRPSYALGVSAPEMCFRNFEPETKMNSTV